MQAIGKFNLLLGATLTLAGLSVPAFAAANHLGNSCPSSCATESAPNAAAPDPKPAETGKTKGLEPTSNPTADPGTGPVPDSKPGNSSGLSVSTSQFDEEARTAEAALQGRLADMQKRFDEDADGRTSKLAENQKAIGNTADAAQ